MSAENWEEHGRRLASNTPIKYHLPPDIILNQLRDVLGSSPLGKRTSPKDTGEPSGTTDHGGRPDKAKRPMQHSDIGVRTQDLRPRTSHLASVFKATTRIGC